MLRHIVSIQQAKDEYIIQHGINGDNINELLPCGFAIQLREDKNGDTYVKCDKRADKETMCMHFISHPRVVNKRRTNKRHANKHVVTNKRRTDKHRTNNFNKSLLNERITKRTINRENRD